MSLISLMSLINKLLLVKVTFYPHNLISSYPYPILSSATEAATTTTAATAKVAASTEASAKATA